VANKVGNGMKIDQQAGAMSPGGFMLTPMNPAISLPRFS
jgi:hypothetical protein